MEEIKILELFDNLLIEVYKNGKIKTFKHNNIRKNGRLDNREGKFLKPKTDKYGYQHVILTKNRKRKDYQVHRLVAQAFIPNLENKPTVNHKDGNKCNNCVENLEWATFKEQKNHSIKNGLCIKNIKALEAYNSKKSIEILFNNKKYNSIREASRLTGRSQCYIKKHGKEIK